VAAVCSLRAARYRWRSTIDAVTHSTSAGRSWPREEPYCEGDQDTGAIAAAAVSVPDAAKIARLREARTGNTTAGLKAIAAAEAWIMAEAQGKAMQGHKAKVVPLGNEEVGRSDHYFRQAF
jgi:hypothetical protein